jgi:hypothetical protein
VLSSTAAPEPRDTPDPDSPPVLTDDQVATAAGTAGSGVSPPLN